MSRMTVSPVLGMTLAALAIFGCADGDTDVIVPPPPPTTIDSGTTGVDPSPAQVLAISPGANDIGVTESIVTLSFSAPMDPVSVESALQISPLGSSPRLLSWNKDNTVLTVDTGVDLPEGETLDAIPETYVSVTLTNSARSQAGQPLVPIEDHRFRLARRLIVSPEIIEPFGHRNMESGGGGTFIRAGDNTQNEEYRAVVTLDVTDFPPRSEIVEVGRAYFDTYNLNASGDPSADFGAYRGMLLSSAQSSVLDGLTRSSSLGTATLSKDLPTDNTPVEVEFTPLMEIAVERELNPVQMRLEFPDAPGGDEETDIFTMSIRFTEVFVELLVY